MSLGLRLLILINACDPNEGKYKMINFIVEKTQNGRFAFNFLYIIDVFFNMH